MSPLVLYIWAIGATVVAIIAIVLHRRNPTPFPDHGSFIAACKDARAVNVMAEVSKRMGMHPDIAPDSKGIKRVITERGNIFNWTDREVHPALADVACGVAFVSKNPEHDSGIVVSMLRGAGYVANNMGQLDEDAPNGAIYFIETDALKSGVIVVRKHALKLGGGRPPKWKSKYS